MKIRVLGKQEDLTGSMTLIEFPCGTKGLIDFGLTQFNNGGIASSMIYNGRKFDFDVDKISFVVITHAHADHLGLLPLLVKRGYKGKIIMTLPTADFASLTLYDTVKIFEGDTICYNKINKNKKSKLEPIFDKEDVARTLGMIQSYGFNQDIEISDTITVTLKKAGHMLGACMPLFKFKHKDKTKKILFTGDTSGLTSRKPFLPPADDFGDIDYLVVESTYGNRVQEKVDAKEQLQSSIYKTCVKNKGTLLIPVFSMQRSSELMWLLRDVYFDNPVFFDIPVYLDSPLAISSQNVMEKNKDFWGEKWIVEDMKFGGSIFDWKQIENVVDYRQSMALGNDGKPKIILSSSGMCEGGRITRHLETFCPRKENEIFFTGYQVNGTVGHGIQNCTKETFGLNGERIALRATVSNIPFSGHADMNQLTSLIQTSKKGKLKQIFIIHGDMEAKEYFKTHLNKHIKGAKITVPKRNKEYEFN